MISLTDYQREIDEINARVHNLTAVAENGNNNNDSSGIPGYVVFVFLIVLAFIIYLLIKLEWKTVK
jgi:cytochrome c1